MAGEGKGYVPPEAYEGSAVKDLESVESAAESQEETYNIGEALDTIQDEIVSCPDPGGDELAERRLQNKIKEIVDSTPDLREALDPNENTISIDLRDRVSNFMEDTIDDLEATQDRIRGNIKAKRRQIFEKGAVVTESGIATSEEAALLTSIDKAIYQLDKMWNTVVLKDVTPSEAEEVSDADIIEVQDADVIELDPDVDNVWIEEVKTPPLPGIRLDSFDDLPEFFSLLNRKVAGREMRSETAASLKEDLINHLIQESGWRLAGKGEGETPAEVYQKLTDPNTTPAEMKQIVETLGQLYSEGTSKEGAAVYDNLQEIQLSEEQGLLTPEEAKAETMRLIKGLESGRGLNLSEAYKSLDAGSLNKNELEKIIDGAVTRESQKLDREIERMSGSGEPAVFITAAEMVDLERSIEQQRAAGQITMADYVGKIREMQASVEVVDLGDVPALLEAGTISLDRAKELRDQLIADYFEKGQEVAIEANRAIIMKQRERNEELQPRICAVVDQLKANGNLPFGSDAIEKMSKDVEAAQAELVKNKVDLSRLEDAPGSILLASKTRKASKKVKAAFKKLEDSTAGRDQLVSDILAVIPDGVLQDGDVDQIGEALSAKVGSESGLFRPGYAAPEAKAAMRRVWNGEMTASEGIAEIGAVREQLQRQLEATKAQEEAARDTGGLFRLIDELNKLKIVNFDSSHYKRTQALTRVPDASVAASGRAQLLKLEGQLRLAEKHPQYPDILGKAVNPEKADAGKLEDMEVFSTEYSEKLPAMRSQIDFLYQAGALDFNGQTYQKAYRQARLVDVEKRKGQRSLNVTDRFYKLQDAYLEARKKGTGLVDIGI